MTHPGQHLADETLSSLVDKQLGSDELALAQSHVRSCPECEARLNELGAVVALLHALPSIEPPRDLRLSAQPVRLGLVPDPPNVIRLRRWYSVARAGAASLAAAFVFLSVGALYMDSQPATTSSGGFAASAPAAIPAASPPAAAARAADPAAQSAPVVPNAGAPAAGAVPGARPQNAAPTANDTAADQTAAATSVRALPTPFPTPTPVRLPVNASPAPSQTPNTVAPLRIAATLVGALAAFGLLLTLVVRHRLKAATITQE